MLIADGPLEATTPPRYHVAEVARELCRRRPVLPAQVQHRRQERPFPRRRQRLFPRLPGEEPAPGGGISYPRGRRAEEPCEKLVAFQAMIGTAVVSRPPSRFLVAPYSSFNRSNHSRRALRSPQSPPHLKSKNTNPALQTSLAGVFRTWPASGASAREPATCGHRPAPTTHARPKSEIFHRMAGPAPLYSRLPAWTSWFTIPTACAAARPRSIWCTAVRAKHARSRRGGTNLSGSVPFVARRSCSSEPSMRS